MAKKEEEKCVHALSNGARSSEFWLSLGAIVLGAVMSSGIVPAAGVAIKVLGIAAATLGALGYTASRTILKSKEQDINNLR